MADFTIKKRMLQEIKETDFTLKELNLYLDTHPNCKEALEMYKTYEQRLKKLMCDYENTFGPLTPSSVNNTDVWTWINGPWPWENC